MPGKDDDFDAAVQEARAVEKTAQPYVAFKGKIETANVLDLTPAEYADYTYDDLVNLYEKVGKIIKTTGLEAYRAAPAPTAPVTPAAKKEMAARKQEVETRVKELTSEALTKAEEIGKELEKPIEKKPEIEAQKPEEEKKRAEEIEFESLMPETIELERPKKEEEKEREEAKPVESGAREIDFDILEEKGKEKEEEEKKAKPEIEFEKEKPLEKEEAPRPRPVIPAARPVAPAERVEKPVAAVPPVLRERAEEAASKRYDEIEQQIMSTMGGEMDEASLKKKMLELTKELFKEKSFNRREQMKLEITVIKNMLARKANRPARGPAAAGAEAKGSILDTVISTQKTELASTKDKILSGYKSQIGAINREFQQAVAALPESDEAGRKAAFEAMVFKLTSLDEQLPQAMLKYQDYLKQKHQSELRKFRTSLGKGEEKLAADTEKRLQDIEDGYAREFATARSIVKKQGEILTETAGRAVFAKEEVSTKETKVRELVAEINEMDEGTLLYSLHSKDPDFYKRYERKHVSRQEAIFRAKELMAREKGLSDDMVRRYFSETEG